MTAENDERDRIRSIVGSEPAARMPTLAQALAFETALDVDQAAAIFAAACADLDAAAPVAPTVEPFRAKPVTGAFGLPDQVGATPAAKDWSRALRHVNGPTDAPQPPRKADHGWDKAMSYLKINAA